jgi:hypothetical protein
MAGTTREIVRAEWKGYFDDFSRELPDLRATVEVAGREIGAQVEAENPRLTGITYDDGDDIVVIALDAPGEVLENVEHVVYHPQKIYVEEEDDVTVFDIEDSEEQKTLVRLEPAP